jgi:acyl-CoA thioester hydrolase
MSIKRRHVHTEVIPIRWGDMDAMGHVNNTIYFRYMEQTRISWFDSLGTPPAPQGTGPIIINASCTFMKELVYPGNVELRMYAGKAGRSSFETWLEMRPSYDPETVYAEGAAKVVWVDFAKGKSVPLPDRIRSLIEG